MRKIATTIIIVLLLGVATLYLYDKDFEEPLNFDDPYITGNIYDIKDESILIAEGVEDKDDFGIMFTGKAIWLSITEETKILSSNNEEISFDELEIGQKVTAWTTGVIAESYPEQGTARMIKKEVELFACYVGGCSGELCTKDPEAISTCELLPGMECIQEGMSCEAVENECIWVLSEEAAQCLLEIEQRGDFDVRESRIGFLFEMAENFSN
jgi:eight-cysteine-cluster-containing protein